MWSHCTHRVAPSGGSASSSCLQVWFFSGEKGRTCVLRSFILQVALSCSHSSCPKHGWAQRHPLCRERAMVSPLLNSVLPWTNPARHTFFLPSFTASQSYHRSRSILFASHPPFHLARGSHPHPQGLHTKENISSSSLFHSGSSTFEDNANHGYNFSNMHQLLVVWKYFREDMTQSQPLLRTSRSTRQWQSCDLRTSCANNEAKNFVRFGLLDSLKTLCRRHSGFGRAYVPAY